MTDSPSCQEPSCCGWGLLSGGLDDGAAGAAAVQIRGGIVLTQDPDEATDQINVVTALGGDRRTSW